MVGRGATPVPASSSSVTAAFAGYSGKIRDSIKFESRPSGGLLHGFLLPVQDVHREGLFLRRGSGSVAAPPEKIYRRGGRGINPALADLNPQLLAMRY